MKVIKRDGSSQPLSIEQIRKQTIPACEGLPGTSADELELDAQIVFTNGMSTQDIQKALVNAASSKIDIDKPNWTYVAARLTLYDLYHKVKRVYSSSGTGNIYSKVLLFDYLLKNRKILDFDKSIFDIDKLENVIKPERDLLFNYIGISTLISRYLIKQHDHIIELPQHMFMGLAMWLAQDEDNPTERAIEFYDALSTLNIVLSTPILSKGRRKGATHISCFVDSVEDSLQGILDHYSSFSFGSKNGGGFGCDWTRVRALGGTIQGQPNTAGGLVPWLKLQNDFSNAVDQLGTRKGSENASIENWHLDVFDFIDLKKTSGEERRRAEDLFLSLSVSDLFMERVINDDVWTLFDPYDVPELTELYGDEFTSRYEEYEQKFKIEQSHRELPNGSSFTNPPKQIKAKELWGKMIQSYFTRGAPYIFFKDTVNRAHKHPELGIIRSSNLCVTGDTKVLTKEYGYIPIQTVAGQTLECWDGKQWTETPLFQTSDGQQVDEICLSNGMSIKATPYHKWYRIKQDKRGKLLGSEEVRTHELNIGDKLIKFDLEPITHGTKELKYAYENGFFSGDGTQLKQRDRVSNASQRMDLYNDKKELLPFFSGYTSANELKTVNKSKETKTSIRFKKNTLKNKFFVPSNKYSVKSRLTWLAGLFDSDGTLTSNDGTESIQISSIEHEFLNSIYLLLQELGIQAKVLEGMKAGYRKMPCNDGSGKSKEYWCKETKRLVIPHSELNKLLSLGYEAYRVMPTYKKLNREAKQFIKITDIKQIEELMPTYCGTTSSDEHKLMFNGQLVGNCMEILQPNNEDETSVCILGSLNLARIDTRSRNELSYYSKLLFRMLDNTIDLSNYPTEKAKRTELSRRAIGIGIMGEAEDIANKQIHYGSIYHIEYVHSVMEQIRKSIDEVNAELVAIRGGYRGSDIYKSGNITQHRCAYQMAIAPTASISLIAGTTSAHEPVFGYKWNEDGLFGPTTLTAPNINPDNYQYYKSAYDIDQKKMLDVCAAHQQYVDQSISHNLYFRPEGLTAGKIADTIIYAWKIGVKTLYYLRSKSQKAQNDDSLSKTISCAGCQ